MAKKDRQGKKSDSQVTGVNAPSAHVGDHEDFPQGDLEWDDKMPDPNLEGGPATPEVDTAHFTAPPVKVAPEEIERHDKAKAVDSFAGADTAPTKIAGKHRKFLSAPRSEENNF